MQATGSPSALERRSPASILSRPPDSADRRDGTARVTETNSTLERKRSTFRVAIAGAGYIADFHAPIAAAQEGVEVVAIVDPDATRARSTAQRFGIARTAASIEELASLRIDVVHLLVPPDVHVPLAKRCFELGMGVFLEKPAALSGDACRELARLAQERGLPFGVNHNNLHHPAFARLLARVRAGEIGRVEHVQVTLSVPLAQLDAQDYAHWMFREPRNIVFEQAVHPLCQVHALVGAVKSAETTRLSQRELLPGQLFVDRWSASAVGERGTAQIYLAFGQGFTRSTIQVLGTDGSLEADLAHNALSGEEKTLWLEFWNGYLALARRARDLRRDARSVLAGWIRFTLGLGPRQDAFWVGMRDSIAGFYAALRSGSTLPTDGFQAAEVLDWCDALAAAAPIPPRKPAAPPEPGPARPGEVVVLGATGFIGRRVVAKLLDERVPVSIVARRAHSLPAQIQEGVASGAIRFLRGSLEDQASLGNAFAGAHAVIQLATGNGDTWEKVERAMVRGSVEVARTAHAAGVKRFVYVSSIAALDTRPGLGEIRDSNATDPSPHERALYSRGKLAAEEALLALHRETGVPLVIARPGVVVGEGTPMQHSGYGLWARDNHCVGWGDGEHALPLVWVDDVADALVAAARHKGGELIGRCMNLCARPPLSAREIVEELARSTGRAIHFHPRSLVASQTMEIGKWVVKKAGRRAGVEFPSWRDLQSRALDVTFSSDLARSVLGWKPVEEREAFLERCVRIYAPRRAR